MMQLFWVFLGGGLGSVARYLTGDLLKNYSGIFPWGTLAANAISCVILGYLVAYHLKSPISPGYRLLLMTGFCGGFSTFSTFSSEAYLLLQDGKFNLALLYVAGSIIIGLLAVVIGFRLA